MKLQNITTTLLLVACGFTAQAQDPFFSQAHRSPLTLNPALAGDGQEHAWRLQSNLRSQWWGGGVEPYRTASVSVERKIAIEDNALTLAAGVQSETSNGGVLKNNFLLIGAAYHNTLDREGKHTVAVGLLGTYANRMLDPMKATTQTQFGSFGFMRGTQAYDPIMARRNRYWDVQSGIGYSYAGAVWSWHLGGAIYHAARPKEGAYNDGGYRISMRSVIESSVGYKNANDGQWTARGNWQHQADHRVEQVALDYRLPIGVQGEDKALVFGLGCRLTDSFFPYLALQWSGFEAGLSYDQVFGSVHRYYNQVNSAELTFKYSFGKQ